MKLKAILLTLVMFTLLLTGCGNKTPNNNNATTTPNPTQGTAVSPTVTSPAASPEATGAAGTPAATNGATTPEATKGAGTDVTTTASIVDTEDALLKALSKNGTWIVCITKDMTVNKELVMEGEFKNGKKDDAGKEVIQRKLALYSQDENRTITGKYVLTAPKLTVTSPKASIQRGTFKGDLYVDVAGFELVDAIIDGDVYFTKKEYKDSFKMDDSSKVLGKQSVK